MVHLFDQIAVWVAHRKHKRAILKREEQFRKRSHPEGDHRV